MTEIDPSYKLLACQYLRRQLDALIKEVNGVRANTDIEPVHQARVASRRMRAALRMFGDCFDSKKVGQWLKRIRKVTRGLGVARDLDVQILFLDQFLARLEKTDRRHRAGVERLQLRLKQDRDRLQPKVVETLDALEKGNAMAEMYGELEKELFLLRHRVVGLQSPYVFAETAAHIQARKQDLLAYASTLANPQDASGHHQLRIEAKRLRYTMEICDAAYDDQLAPAIKVVKKVQSLLGDIHDCDVWGQRVTTFMEQERRRTIDYFGHPRSFSRLKPGLQLLMDERRCCREDLFTALVEFWKTLEADGFWDWLDATLASCAQKASVSIETKDLSNHDSEEKTDDNRDGE